MQEEFAQRSAGYVARIDELGAKLTAEEQRHAQTQESYKHFRWASYGVGAAIITSAGFMFWTIAN